MTSGIGRPHSPAPRSPSPSRMRSRSPKRPLRPGELDDDELGVRGVGGQDGSVFEPYDEGGVQDEEKRKADQLVDIHGGKMSRAVYETVSGTSFIEGTKAVSRARRKALPIDANSLRETICKQAIKKMEQQLNLHVMTDLREQYRIEYGDKVITGSFLPGFEVR